MEDTQKKVDLFTDGACSGNPGPGGYGAILRFGTNEKEISGGSDNTTNNRMELMAVIEGLNALKSRCTVSVYSDSKYIVDAVKNGWAVKWRENGWSRGRGKPALNPDLWGELLNLLEQHDVTFHWVKGHAGHPENERCDQLAVAESRKHGGTQ